MTDPAIPSADEEPAYDPSHSVSYSSMTLHRQCPQAWSYKYLRDLETTSSRHAPDLGSWWHLIRAMDSLKRGKALTSLRQSPRSLTTGHGLKLLRATDKPTDIRYVLPSGKRANASTELALALAKAYWRTLSGDAKDSWIDEIGESVPDRLAVMSDRYVERWSADLATEYPIAVELRVEQRLGPDDTEDPAQFVGYVDEVYEDSRRSLIVVRDHKTGKSLPGADAEADLGDSQLHLYAWAVNDLVASWLPNRQVQALSYDRVRSAKPKPPSLTLAGNLSKSVTDYDLSTYLEFASGPDGDGVVWGTEGEYVKSGKNEGAPKFGTYVPDPEIVSKLGTESSRSVWHQRTLTPLNKRIVATHLAATQDTQRQAERTVAYFEEHHEAPRNFNRFLCGRCDFRRICAAEMTGGADGDYVPSDYGLSKRVR